MQTNTNTIAQLQKSVRRLRYGMAAIAIANQEQIRVSIDGADPFVVGACKDQISHVLEEFADVVFMNADEAHALLGCGPEEAAKRLSEDVEHVIVKTGASGSLVARRSMASEGRLTFFAKPLGRVGDGRPV